MSVTVPPERENLAATTPIERTEPSERQIASTLRGADVQRRRREVALTATWLRELRGVSSDATVTSRRFRRAG
jgi:hypothetical protein